MTASELWWMATGSMTAASIAPFMRVLSDAERTRSAGFHFEHDRRDYLAAHSLLRWSLSKRYQVQPSDWNFEKTDLGKPRVSNMPEDTSIEFSLSHTRGLVAVGISHTAVGVDVEWTGRRTNPSLADGLFAEEELAELHTLPEQDRRRRFLELWTLKESYVKALGTGLSHPLDSFYFVQSAGKPRLCWKGPRPEKTDWQFIQAYPTSEHVMAVAVSEQPHSASLGNVEDVPMYQVTLADWDSMR